MYSPCLIFKKLFSSKYSSVSNPTILASSLHPKYKHMKYFSLCEVCVQGQCTKMNVFFHEDPQGNAQHSEIYHWF